VALPALLELLGERLDHLGEVEGLLAQPCDFGFKEILGLDDLLDALTWVTKNLLLG
jgi:hypothetical protein